MEHISVVSLDLELRNISLSMSCNIKTATAILSSLGACVRKVIGTFCLFEYRALFCVIWSFFGKKWPKKNILILKTLHLLDI